MFVARPSKILMACTGQQVEDYLLPCIRGEKTDCFALTARHWPPPSPCRLRRAPWRPVQIYGGMGLMDEGPVERIWRNARIERIWEGTSEIHRCVRRCQ